ncbi:hypothetical protein DLM76_12425 [Leptospira yasudae]|uniref:4'-phosphopantetheinyl transferase family protein n=1 Tax=Leptospira yasudae TaxID=2202201 RepID=UPI000E599081|nr:4'-phosphopantetheinyl transferase superfamily protein [Leptospira yasudae]RHX93799.1 hypothetical protein DLM76_12425 [Leptospira yasudae]
MANLLLYTFVPIDLEKAYLDVGSNCKWYLREFQNKLRWTVDQHNYSLIGRILLNIGFQKYELTRNREYQVQFSEFGRPFVDGRVDFNISHSQGIVGCAFSDAGRVGFDVEKIVKINSEDFLDFFSNSEIKKIQSSASPNLTFMQFWTKKEAILKLVGSGVNDLADLRNVNLSDKLVVWRGKNINLSKIELDPSYSAYAAAENSQSFVIKEISIREMLWLINT